MHLFIYKMIFVHNLFIVPADIFKQHGVARNYAPKLILHKNNVFLCMQKIDL